jgi:serine/threonine protein kinase
MENCEFNPVLLMLKNSPQCFSHLPSFLQTRLARLKLIEASEVFRKYISRNTEKIINLRIKVIEKILPMVVWVLSNNDITSENTNCSANGNATNVVNINYDSVHEKEDGEYVDEDDDEDEEDQEDDEDEEDQEDQEDEEDEEDQEDNEEEEDDQDEEDDEDDDETWNGSLFKVADYVEFDKFLNSLLNNNKKIERQVLQLAKLLFLSPVYNIVGDRFIVLGKLDDVSPVLKALDTFTNSKVAIKVLLNGKVCYDEICKTRFFSTISPEFVDIISIEPIAFTESMGSKSNKYRDGKQMPLVIVFPKLSKCLFRQRQDFEDSHKIPYNNSNQLTNEAIVADTSNGKTKSVSPTSAKIVPVEQFIKIFYPLANAFAKLHRAGFIHGDIKLDNIMHSASGIKIIDMGLAKQINIPLSDTRLYTVGYVPPEIRQTLRKMIPSGKLDVFAFGITMLLFLTPSIDDIFTSLSSKQYIIGQRLIVARLRELQLSGKTSLACLLSSMLDFDETRRITMNEVLDHVFWKENNQVYECHPSCKIQPGNTKNQFSEKNKFYNVLPYEIGSISIASKTKKDPVSIESQYLTCVENSIFQHQRNQ